MTIADRKLPAAVMRGKELAEMIRGRRLLFKCSNYMGAVHVDQATCSYRWFSLKMMSSPWLDRSSPRVLEWMVPPNAIRETRTQIRLRVHDMVGSLVYDAKRIEEIEMLFRMGATVQQLLDAFNRWDLPPLDAYAPTPART